MERLDNYEDNNINGDVDVWGLSVYLVLFSVEMTAGSWWCIDKLNNLNCRLLTESRQKVVFSSRKRRDRETGVLHKDCLFYYTRTRYFLSNIFFKRGTALSLAQAFQNWSSNLAIMMFRLVEFHLKTAIFTFFQKCKTGRLILSTPVLRQCSGIFLKYIFDTNQGELMCK